jgi:L-ornithine N5-oxygenase
MTVEVNSVVGVGFGPANLALALALDEIGFSGRIRFMEQAADFQWQQEQLLAGTDIQNNPFRDLVMPRNPYSRYTFVNFLASRGELTDYLHLNAKFPLRRHYAAYLRWVADAFRDRVDYASSVVKLSVVDSADSEVFRVDTDNGRSYHGKALVLGTGRSARIPPAFAAHVGPTIFHSTRYLSSLTRLTGTGLRVAVIGASQSAIEIILDLLGHPNVRQVVSIQRGIGFRLKDTSPYSRRVFLPEFVDYFHPLPPATKLRIRAELRSVNYAACDQDVIDRLASLQQEYALTNSDRFQLLPFSEVVGVDPAPGGMHRLAVRDVNYGSTSGYDADVVILATGFRDFGTGLNDEPYHPMLAGLADRMSTDATGMLNVARDYSVDVRTAGGGEPLKLYLNGLCEASHGMGDAGALAVLSARASDISAAISRRAAQGARPRAVPATAGR